MLVGVGILLLDVDFALLQEVDTDSTRSYQVNQKEALERAFPDDSSAFAVNFHSAYLAYPLGESGLPDGFSVVRAGNIETVPTCRNNDVPYEKGYTFIVTVDGFVVSSNVRATAENIDTGFAWSDHNPVKLTFTLERGWTISEIAALFSVGESLTSMFFLESEAAGFGAVVPCL